MPEFVGRQVPHRQSDTARMAQRASAPLPPTPVRLTDFFISEEAFDPRLNTPRVFAEVARTVVWSMQGGPDGI
ncbi:MAG: hypothetical protein HY268_03495 [Deltaproteobacteria bacterium]|nr:hypothetical protein [Deltaproteobacteria bacterium]